MHDETKPANDALPMINDLLDLARIVVSQGWGGLDNIGDGALKEHIIARAHALNLTGYLPDSWGGDEQGIPVIFADGKGGLRWHYL